MVPNMLFWHETSSEVEKSWKIENIKFHWRARGRIFFYYTEQKNSNYNCNSNFSADVPWRHVYGTWDGGDFLCNQCNITGERYTMYQDREYIEQFNTRVLSIYRTWCHSKNRTCLWVMEKRKVNHAWFSVSLVFCFSWKLFIVYPRSRRVSG